LDREQQSQESKRNKGYPPKQKPQIIRVLRALKRQYHRYAAEYEKQKSDHAGNERMMAFWTKRVGQFTILLAIIAVLSAGISFWSLRVIQGQLDEMRSSGEDTKLLIKAAQDSAKAAQDALTLATENSQRQLRAYVSIESVDCILKDNVIHVTVAVRNSGQTPAYNFSIDAHLEGEGDFRLGIVNKPVQPAPKITIGRDQTIRFTLVRVAIGDDNNFIPSLKNGDAKLLVIGGVEYQDVFGNAHHFSFRLRSFRFVGETLMIEPDPKGIEAD